MGSRVQGEIIINRPVEDDSISSPTNAPSDVHPQMRRAEKISDGLDRCRNAVPG
jgi:hypothetical protein